MIQINLLPWREQVKQAKIQRFGILLGVSVCLVMIVILLGHLLIDNMISRQLRDNAELKNIVVQEQTQLTMLDKKEEAESGLIANINFIIGLQNKSYRAVRLLDEMSKIVPQSLWFSKLKRENDIVTIIGKAKSDLQITLFMKNIAQSKYFEHPDLTKITEKENEQERDFELKVKQLD